MSEVVAAYARSGLQSDDDSALMRASFNLSVYYEQAFMPLVTEFTMKYSEGNVQVVVGKRLMFTKKASAVDAAADITHV